MNNTSPVTEDDVYTTVSGRVVADGDGRVYVDVPRRSACQSCGKERGCGMSVLGGLSVSQSLRLELGNVLVEPGDTIQIGCPQNGLVKAAVLAYAPPALGVVAGATAAALNGFGDGGQALGAMLGLALGLLTTRWMARRSALPKMYLLKE